MEDYCKARQIEGIESNNSQKIVELKKMKEEKKSCSHKKEK